MRIEDPVPMCQTFDNVYWVRGHVSRDKFRGALLSKVPLEGDEDARDILAGRIQRGWVITVSGDWSGCGGDYVIYFLTEEPPEVGEVWEEPPEDLYEDGENPGDGIIMDKQLATWWEAKR